MTIGDRAGEPELTLDYEFDASPEKVWRALSIAEYRERWLPEGDIEGGGPIAVEEGSEISYRIRDTEPPHIESTVTFRIARNEDGGTRLEIVQRIIGTQIPVGVNDNGGTIMLAA